MPYSELKGLLALFDEDYLYHLANDRKVPTSTLNNAINALKFYYGEVLKRRFVYTKNSDIENEVEENED